MVLRHLCINECLSMKLTCWWIGPFSITKMISLGILVGSAPNQADLPCLSYLKFEEISLVGEFGKGGVSLFTHLWVDGEEEFKMEAILRHKGTGAWRLYQVLWKDYPITEVGSLNCISTVLLKSWTTIYAMS